MNEDVEQLLPFTWRDKLIQELTHAAGQLSSIKDHSHSDKVYCASNKNVLNSPSCNGEALPNGSSAGENLHDLLHLQDDLRIKAREASVHNEMLPATPQSKIQRSRFYMASFISRIEEMRKLFERIQETGTKGIDVLVCAMSLRPK